MAEAAASKEPSVKKVADQVAQDVENGYRGVKVDQTPNENYTVAGVTSGKPTPETDKK